MHNKKLQKIISKSTFTLTDGIYIYVKVKSISKKRNHFMITRDRDEITVVTKLDNLKYLDLIEKNKDDYSLISLNVSIPFYSVGFLAAITNALANKRMDILIVSTYSKDYIMVKTEKQSKCINALLELGLKQVS